MSGKTVSIVWLVPGPKITRYLLDLTSKRGASKARYLMRFGFSLADPQALADALVEHAMSNLPGVKSVSRYGVPMVVFEGLVEAPDGRAMPLRSVWEPREPFEMHLITAVPLTS